MLLLSCNKSETSTPDYLSTLHRIGDAHFPDGNVASFYAFEPLTTGYNPIFFKMMKDGKSLPPATVTFSTLMDMGDMQHSSPSVSPSFNPGLGAYEAGAIFTMPTQAKEWSLIIRSDNEEAVLKTNVTPAATRVSDRFTTTGGEEYFLAVYPAKNFKIGINDFSLVIFRKNNAMSFAPVPGLSIEFHPYMASMGHGSSGNINPVDAGQGFYTGKVNFTMSGDWQLHFTIRSNDTILIEDATLDIAF